MELSRQAELLTHLGQYLKMEGIPLSVPEMKASEAGDLLVDDAGYVWCLTRHLPGFHPAADDAGVYLPLTEGLAQSTGLCAYFKSRSRCTSPMAFA